MKTFDLIGLFVSFCSVVSIFDEHFYLSDLLSSFRFQYLVFLVIWLLYTLSFRKKYLIVGILFPIFFNLYYLVPTWSVSKIDELDLKIYFVNVLSSNDKYGLVIKDILNKKPDIIVLQEVTEAWKEELSKLSKKYPYNVVVPREDNFGVAVYSSIEFEFHKTYLSSAGLESILVDLAMANRNISILTTHPLPPVSQDYWRLRNEQYDEIKDYFKEANEKKILIGDLNTVPWSSYVQEIEKDNQIKSVNSFKDTWNTFFPPMLRIRTLFALVSNSITGEILVSDDIGSDHLPFLLKIKFNKDKL